MSQSSHSVLALPQIQDFDVLRKVALRERTNEVVLLMVMMMMAQMTKKAETCELKRLLRQKASCTDRPRSSIGSVRIEEFQGDRRKYLRWKRSFEAQDLYLLEQVELAMLVYLSTRSKARDVVDQLPLADYIAREVPWFSGSSSMRVFERASRSFFERAEKELANYRRLPGQSIATFLAGMQRLRAQYQRVDPDSTISDKAWSQKLLAKAFIGRRERFDVFHSAGGSYNAVSIEAALRHRCATVHEDERRLPHGGREGFGPGSMTTARSFRSRTTSSSGGTSSTRIGEETWCKKCTVLLKEEAGEDDGLLGDQFE